jgi:hypothetical protein
MGNINKKIETNLERRQKAFDSLPATARKGFIRPGSRKKKGK